LTIFLADQQATENQNYLSKSGDVTWVVPHTGQLRCVGRFPAHNVFRATPGLKGHARHIIDPQSKLSAFQCLFDDFILRLIAECTTKEAHRQRKHTDWSITKCEMGAFIGLMLIRGAMCSTRISVPDLWSSQWGIGIFKKTMPRDRFKEILRYTRFDDKQTRSERLKNDKFGMVSTIWNRFMDNCRTMYCPTQNLTVDEQLMPCKTRCPFTQYMANKPDKYGIKFWLLSEVESKYVLNAVPYLGKCDARPADIQLGHHVVLQLTEPYKHMGYNVTADNFFTSLPLANDMLKRKFSFVGTMRKNRRELPKQLPQLETTMNRYSSMFFLEEKDSLVSLTYYKSKPSKAVCLLSTLHQSYAVDETHLKKLPSAIHFYNHTKTGVDASDQMTRLYTTRCGNRRWPFQVFCNLLDFCGINSWILYKKATHSTIARRKYIMEVGEELCNLFLASKSDLPNVVEDIEEALDTGDCRKRRQCQISDHKIAPSMCV
jgi:hypothetical protein